ncbi:MAG: oxidoreductase [Bacteroidota bacterium]
MKAINRHRSLARFAFFLILPGFLGLTTFNKLTTQKTGMTGTIRGLDVVSEKVIWISGTGGEYSFTSDGGTTWLHQVVRGAEKLDFRDVQGFSADAALLMSAGPGSASKIYRTTDGGKSWTLTYENSDSLAFFDGMDFFDDQEGLVISDPVDSKPYLLGTINGGLTWSRMVPLSIPDLVPGEYAFAASGTSIDALPDGQCWLATGGSVARAFKSEGHGKTWSVTSLPVLHGNSASGAFSIARGPGKNVAACGGDYQETGKSGSNIALSFDDGITWESPTGSSSVPFMECIRWISSKTLISCGPPGVWISKDSGKNWHEISKDGFHTMDIVPGGRTVWLAGNGGKVIILDLATL